MGSTQRYLLDQETVSREIIEGFFPLVSWNDSLVSVVPSGFRQIGLPYAQEPAITKHLHQFLKRHLETNPSSVFPSRVLFNGGALTPILLQQRLCLQLEQWRSEYQDYQGIPSETQGPIFVLETVGLNLAVARGAAYYHVARKGEGITISGGSARSYYVQVAVEGDEDGTEHWVCVLPQHTMPETMLSLPETSFALQLQRPVQFRLMSSVHRPHDTLGQFLKWNPQFLKEHEFIELPPIQMVIQKNTTTFKKQTTRQVYLRSQLNEIGTLSVFCVAPESKEQWKLQFRLKPQSLDPISGESISMVLDREALSVPQRNPSWELAAAGIQKYYGKKIKTSVKEIEKSLKLYRELESLLQSPREQWSPPLLRYLGDQLYEGMSFKGRSPQHELHWLKVLGYCLRPGYGVFGDEWRIQQLQPFLLEGPQFKKESSILIEWWIFGRRIAGGVSPQIQQKWFESLQKKEFLLLDEA